VFTVQKALAVLNEGASIILTGSTSASRGVVAFGVYPASKAALSSSARTWAAELSERGIRVNTIVPGPTDTPGLRGLAPHPGQVSQLLDKMAAGVPIGRIGTSDEIANAILFLASDQSSFVTGSELFADGGEVHIWAPSTSIGDTSDQPGHTRAQTSTLAFLRQPVAVKTWD
jgi:NAD(P)-dependent dehydrogenase (short-subunit alcohol dehydrogenase family)